MADTHACPADGCPRTNVPRSKLACPRHWALVSKQGQQMVYDAYRSGDFTRHVKAMALAVHEMNAAQGTAAAR